MTQNAKNTPPHLRWNLVAFFMDLAWFRVAFTFFSPDSVVPGFVGQLIDSAFVIGLVSAIFKIGWMLPQMAVARAINHKPRKMPYLVFGLIGRIGFWLIPLALWSNLPRYPTVLILSTGCFVLFTAFDSIAGVAWFDILERAIPPRMRGRLLGIGQSVSGLVGIGAGALIKLILGRYTFPDTYALIFFLAGLALVPSTIAVLLIREPPAEDARPEEETKLERGWIRRLLADPDCRNLILCRVLVGMMMLATPFYVSHAQTVLKLPESAIGDFVIAQTIAGVVVSAGLGWLHERHGPRIVIRIGTAAAAIAPAYALATHLAGGGWLTHAYPVIFVALGVINSTWIMGFFNYVLEIAPQGKRSAYVGAINSMIWPLMLMSVVGGWLLENTSYTVLFSVTAIFVAGSFLISLRLKPSRKSLGGGIA